VSFLSDAVVVEGDRCYTWRLLADNLLLPHYPIDLIFKNQAISQRDKDNRKGEFVNDLLRTEFHKYVFVSFSSSHGPFSIK
jgi:hypothetical protein